MLSMLGSVDSQIKRPEKLYLISTLTGINYDVIGGFEGSESDYFSTPFRALNIDLPTNKSIIVNTENEIDFTGYTKLVVRVNYVPQYVDKFRYLSVGILSIMDYDFRRNYDKECVLDISNLKSGKFYFSARTIQFASASRASCHTVYLTN